jgi:hypothetical protein
VQILTLFELASFHMKFDLAASFEVNGTWYRAALPWIVSNVKVSFVSLNFFVNREMGSYYWLSSEMGG